MRGRLRIGRSSAFLGIRISSTKLPLVLRCATATDADAIIWDCGCCSLCCRCRVIVSVDSTTAEQRGEAPAALLQLALALGAEGNEIVRAEAVDEARGIVGEGEVAETSYGDTLVDRCVRRRVGVIVCGVHFVQQGEHVSVILVVVGRHRASQAVVEGMLKHTVMDVANVASSKLFIVLDGFVDIIATLLISGSIMRLGRGEAVTDWLGL
ncbi:hypothetical protein PG984_007372 [Apiospora sp. TS-2023a]